MTGGKTLLLVEDRPDDVALALRAFRRTGVVHEVVVVRDGEEAHDYLFGPGRQALPDLILLDLSLPKFNGLEVLRRIRDHERTRTIPVIVLTSSSEERDVSQSYALGANSFVRKPVDFTEFAEAARLLCQYWFVLNQAPRGGDR